MPNVDVAVVTWNTREHTPGALRALLDSDQGCDITLYVRDNDSADGTADAVAERVPEAHLDRGTENLGFGAGMNTIFARSSAPWIFLLNPDATPQPGAIGRLVAAAERHPQAGMVAPRLENEDGTFQHSAHPFPSLAVAADVALRWHRLPASRTEQLLLEGSWQGKDERRIDWSIAAAWLIRRSALEKIGGFDESFFMYAEDLEWCYRAHRRGYEIWFEPSAVVTHIGNVSGEQKFGDRRTRAHLRNTIRFYRREHGAAGALAWWGLNLAGAGVRSVSAMRHRRRTEAARWRRYGKDLVGAFFNRRPEGR